MNIIYTLYIDRRILVESWMGKFTTAIRSAVVRWQSVNELIGQLLVGIFVLDLNSVAVLQVQLQIPLTIRSVLADRTAVNPFGTVTRSLRLSDSPQHNHAGEVVRWIFFGIFERSDGFRASWKIEILSWEPDWSQRTYKVLWLLEEARWGWRGKGCGDVVETERKKYSSIIEHCKESPVDCFSWLRSVYCVQFIDTSTKWENNLAWLAFLKPISSMVPGLSMWNAIHDDVCTTAPDSIEQSNRMPIRVGGLHGCGCEQLWLRQCSEGLWVHPILKQQSHLVLIWEWMEISIRSSGKNNVI